MKTYKLHIPKNSTYYFFKTGQEESLIFDHWTTIKIDEEEEPSDFYIKWYGKANLMKQIAKTEWGNIRLWKLVELDNSDIEIVRV